MMKKHDKSPPGPVVRGVRFIEAEDKQSVSRIEFILTSTARASLATATTLDLSRPSARMFALEPPHEYVVCVRFNELDMLLTGVQVQTNLGRRSLFYHVSATDTHGRSGVRRELYAPEGECIVDFSRSASSQEEFQIRCAPRPPVKRRKLRRLLLLPSVRSLLLKANSESGKTAAGHIMRGGRKAVALQAVRHGLAGKMLSAGPDGDALVRLILDGEEKVSRSSGGGLARRLSSVLSLSRASASKHGEEHSADEDSADEGHEEEANSVGFPPSLLRALCEPGPVFDYSIMDLLSSGRNRDGRAPLMRVLFESGVAKIVFARSKHHKKCLAELMLTPDRARGLRSLMQLMTDDEALNDPARPSLLRSMLVGEGLGTKPSVLRIMFLKPPSRSVTSLMDELLRDDAEVEEGSCARRLLTETPERPVSLARLFFSDSPSGKPALAKYVFGGEAETDERPSLMRLMVQGEAREQNSLLRLLIGFRGAADKSLLDLMTINSPSLMDILLKGEDAAFETSLARLMLGTTFTIEDGRLRMGSALGTAKGDVGSVLSKPTLLEAGEEEHLEREAALQRRLRRGFTVAKACMLGEEHGGPGISLMRVLLMGEEQGLSVLRLLLVGEDKGEVSPLRIVLTGMHAAFVAAQSVADSSKDVLERPEGLLELATQPRKWAEALQRVSSSVLEAVNESHQAGGTWRESFDKLVALGKKQLQSRDAWEQNLAFLYTAFARVRSMGPEFAATWKKQWLIVSKEIRLTGERVRPESAWKHLAPVIAALTESIAEQHWQRVFLNVAQVLQAVEAAAAGTGGTQQNTPLAKALNLVEEIVSWAPKWL